MEKVGERDKRQEIYREREVWALRKEIGEG
jgi:hypothetical protein